MQTKPQAKWNAKHANQQEQFFKHFVETEQKLVVWANMFRGIFFCFFTTSEEIFFMSTLAKSKVRKARLTFWTPSKFQMKINGVVNKDVD